MIRRMGRSVMVGIVIGVAANGCRDATGPDGVAGNYRLERYEGMPLPAFLRRRAASHGRTHDRSARARETGVVEAGVDLQARAIAMAR
jgi:hypothetical protein